MNIVLTLMDKLSKLVKRKSAWLWPPFPTTWVKPLCDSITLEYFDSLLCFRQDTYSPSELTGQP